MKTVAQAPELTKVNHDINGNPRRVVHFLALINEGDRIASDHRNGDAFAINTRYEIALDKARKIGGHKFHNKQYGGGIVFQSYNDSELINRICELKEVNTEFKSEWTPKEVKFAERKIAKFFLSHTFKAITTAQPQGANFLPVNYLDLDNQLGLAYTSTSAYAALWICNAITLMADETRHFIGFAINATGHVVAICEDQNEKNTVYIQL